MQNSRFFMAAIGSGIVFFFLGWLVYGMMLMDFYTANSGLSKEIADQVNKAPEQMNMWALIVSNLAGGFMLATVFSWGKINSMMQGFTAGAWLGLLITAMFDFSMYGTTNMMSLKLVSTDLVVGALLTGITGGVTAWILGMGKVPVTQEA